jgi:hypothetical protein
VCVCVTPTTTTSLPPEVSECCTVFESFYLRKYQGRKVTWQTSMGGADIKANFSGRRHELNVSTYQMCILMLFNKVRVRLSAVLQRRWSPDRDAHERWACACLSVCAVCVVVKFTHRRTP